MSAFKLRPHHGLCIRFFKGMGYSAEFTQNMQDIIRILKANDPVVILSPECDVLCSCCPHNLDGTCSSQTKVQRFDDAVLRLCGLSPGKPLHWSEFSALVSENILNSGRLCEVCTDCDWYHICEEANPV